MTIMLLALAYWVWVKHRRRHPRWKKRRGEVTTDKNGVQWTNMGRL